MNPAPPRGVPRVAALCPCRSVSILVFLAGGIQKRNGRQEAGAALPFEKRKRAGFEYNKVQTARMHQTSRLHKIRNTKWSLAIQNSLRNGEAQNLYALGPTLPSARNHPHRFEEQYKTAGMGPWKK